MVPGVSRRKIGDHPEQGSISEESGVFTQTSLDLLKTSDMSSSNNTSRMTSHSNSLDSPRGRLLGIKHFDLRDALGRTSHNHHMSVEEEVLLPDDNDSYHTQTTQVVAQTDNSVDLTVSRSTDDDKSVVPPSDNTEVPPSDNTVAPSSKTVAKPPRRDPVTPIAESVTTPVSTSSATVSGGSSTTPPSGSPRTTLTKSHSYTPSNESPRPHQASLTQNRSFPSSQHDSQGLSDDYFNEHVRVQAPTSEESSHSNGIGKACTISWNEEARPVAFEAQATSAEVIESEVKVTDSEVKSTTFAARSEVTEHAVDQNVKGHLKGGGSTNAYSLPAFSHTSLQVCIGLHQFWHFNL